MSKRNFGRLIISCSSSSSNGGGNGSSNNNGSSRDGKLEKDSSNLATATEETTEERNSGSGSGDGEASDLEDSLVSISSRFVEVICKCTGKTWRFAAGTEAKFALKFINSNSVDSILANQPATYIEAVKDGEVPVIFGPNSILVNYGKGWKLQSVTETTKSFSRGKPDDCAAARPTYIPPVLDNSHSSRRKSQAAPSPIYIGKILLVFVLMFLIGALFTLLLDNLPQLLSRYGLDVE